MQGFKVSGGEAWAIACENRRAQAVRAWYRTGGIVRRIMIL